METRYTLNLNQVKILRAIAEAFELSPPEIAVNSRLLPNQVVTALNALEQVSLISSYYPVTGRTGERLVNLTTEGRAVARALSQFEGTPPVGAAVPLPSRSLFSGWLTPGPIVGSGTPHVLVADDADK